VNGRRQIADFTGGVERRAPRKVACGYRAGFITQRDDGADKAARGDRNQYDCRGSDDQRDRYNVLNWSANEHPDKGGKYRNDY
jgi:hypothetical protein